MDKKTKDILERFAQRLIDNNSRSRTYFLGQLKTVDTIDLFAYTNLFNKSVHLSNSILKHSKIVFPYTPIIPSKIVEFLKDNDANVRENKGAFQREISRLIPGINEKDNNMLYSNYTKGTINEILPSVCDKYNENSRAKYLTIDTLNMNAKQLEKESARTELYIGYPFIEGTFFSGKSFRAPLLLHSVSIESSPFLKTIKFSDEVYVNPVFMISYVVENKMPHQCFDFDFSESKDILKSTAKFIKDRIALDLNFTGINKIVPFVNCTKNTYEEKYKLYPGEFKVVPNAVIGIFPISSKSIYYDLKNIIELDECNSLLKNFLSIRQKDTPIDEYFNQNEEKETREDKIEVIGPNDISQKMIVRDSMYHNLVIQGPPGTGKSQTIVNIIATNVGKGRSVLVVSEKKTAIDVIYNRLEKLANFSLIVRNLDKDKTSFYKQLQDTLTGIKGLSIEDTKKQIRLYQKNKSINNFFIMISKYHDIIAHDYDGYTFDEIAQSQKVDIDKDLYIKIKALASNYESFSNVISKVFVNGYLESYYLLKEEIDNFETYKILHFDLKLIEKVKNIFTLNISNGAKKYLFNRVYYGLPTKDYNVPFKENIKFIKLSREVKEYYNIIKNEILKLNLDLFKNGDDYYNDAELLEFVSTYKMSVEEITSFYQKILYDDVYRDNKNTFKFIQNYEENASELTKNLNEKEDLCLENILGRIVSKIVKASSENRDVFEGIKELERLANLQRKKSIPFVVERGFSSLRTMYPIWLVTPEVASSILPVQTDIFDVVVFDEASQMFIENAAGVLFRSKRAIVAGDAKQLRPSSVFSSRYVEDETVLDSDKMAKKNVAALEEESLLDYAAHKFPQKPLRYHYRSEHKDLIEFSAFAFYENKLFFASSNKVSYPKPLEVVQVANGLWKDNTNVIEANEVVKKVIEVIKTKKKQDTIGIVTFNDQQRKLIDDLLQKEASKNEDEEVRRAISNEFNRINEDTLEDISMFIKNIENVQGDERDIIIFSITYARNEEGKLNTNFGLLSMNTGENRLNVAITRAKKKIIIVKSFYSYELMINESNNGPYYFKKYLQYAELVNDNKSEERHTLLRGFYHNDEDEIDVESIKSLLKDDIQEKLQRKISKNYEVITNYEVGSFMFDIVIKNTIKNTYDVCIKTDISLLSDKTFDQENDYYCDMYLKSRGWKFVRVFASNYWKNSNQEIKKILEKIK